MQVSILYVGYWSMREPLTHSVIIPRLKLLSAKAEVERILFISIEREEAVAEFDPIEKVKWIPMRSQNKRNVFLTKLSDFTDLPALIKKTLLKENINLVLANSPLAGGACYLAMRKTNIPLIVECFEPHADSMIESGVWTKMDLRYWILKFFEKKQQKTAWKLQVVSENYKRKLLRDGIDNQKIEMVANCLDIDRFRFSSTERQKRRQQLGWQDTDVVGIYVGKFGGIYYDEDAFDLFARAFHYFTDRFRLLILTPDSIDNVEQELRKRNIPDSSFLVKCVPHGEVAKYLSIADFAFATIKPTPIRLYCCPVKDGEYWANGLPILLEDGIGDDSGIIKSEGGGVILDLAQPEKAFLTLKEMLISERTALLEKVVPIAVRYRSLKLMEAYYNRVLKELAAQEFTRP